MSNIDKHALRESAEKALSAKARLALMESVFDDDGDDVKPEAQEDIRICVSFNDLTNPSTVLALLDERERNQQYIKRRDQENEDIALTVGKLRVELEAAEKRIAELEAREISLPERSSMLHRTDFHDDYQTVMAYKVSEV
ncbi:ead/Ea22-like family protein, partial [Escherichia coli]|nr:ead/Ea22-like family protein [Escherichia coli]